jgi:hypothetical protein
MLTKLFRPIRSIYSRWRHLILVLIFLSIVNAAKSQENFKVKGITTDSTSKRLIDEATIVVLSAKDSILQKFTYTKKGKFEMNGLTSGKYILMVSYPEYAEFTASFELDAAHPSHDFDRIRLILQSKLLNEVIINSRIVPMRMNGDTTEFNAAAYATQKNAKVEDLLKQLHGMRINQSGVIMFQGEPVGKFLVDGEEFFSDDPALITKNIRADMVSKIQVYDQKSEKAKLTGIDDGVKIKTINVVLQEDKRKGVFGKAEAGYGSGDYYVGQVMVNKFTVKEKIAAYGNISNSGRVGLNGSDNDRYGIGYNGGFGYDGIGLPNARDAGGVYNKKWNEDKQSINSGYSIKSLDIDAVTSSITQNNLPDNYNKTVGNSESHSSNLYQSLNANFETKLDSTSDLRANLYSSGSKYTTNNQNSAFAERGNGVRLNNSDINSTVDRSSDGSYLDAKYSKRLKKKGRSISLSGGVNVFNSKNESFYISDLAFFNTTGSLDSTVRLDQYKPSDYNSTYLSAGASYSESLFKTISLNTSYNFSSNRSEERTLSFNKSGSGKYDIADPLFSNEFKTNTISNRYNLGLNWAKPSVSLNINTGLEAVNLKQLDQLADTTLSRNFLNFRPGAYFWKQLTKAASININYTGNTVQPTLYQLQPARQNNDPLNIRVGNSLLTPAFSNEFRFKYRVYQPTLDRGINFNVVYGNTLRAIVDNRTTDSAGKNVFTYSNLKEKTPDNLNISSEVYGHIPKLDAILSLNFGVARYSYYSYVNNSLLNNKTTTYSPVINVWKNKVNYSYYFNIGYDITVNETNLQQIDNNTSRFFSDIGFFTKLPLNFFIGSDVNYEFTGKNQVFNRDFERMILKAYFGKNFLKNENLKLSVTGNDLLNQNTGYSRNVSTSMFTEQRNNTIRRNLMFSLSWDFSKFGKSLQKQGS